MASVKVVECSQVGSLDGLVIAARPEPTAGPGTVVVDVAAAGVNYVDALFVLGRYQIKPPVPFVPGSEIAGTITAVGDGVDPERVGERVVAMCGLGGFAESVVLAATSVIPIPDNLDEPRAATFIQSYCTARFALENRAGLTEGETVLVFGAGGGVGQATVAVARAAGARVAGVASSDDKRAAALAAGAEVVFDPSGRRASTDGTITGGEAASDEATDPAKSLIETVREWSGGGVDVALDPVGGEMTVAALRCLRLFGRLLVIGFPAGISELPANQILLRNRSVLGVDWGAWSMHDIIGQRTLLDGLLADVAAGRLEPSAPQVRPLAEVVGALDDLLSRRVTGKLVLTP